MKRLLIPALTLFLLASASCLLAQGTAFTYQGRLTDGGAPATGIYDLRFTIYDASAVGNAVAGPAVLPAVPVTNGRFTVLLDFGSAAFDGSARWLEIGARTNDSADSHTVLAPRQALTAAPYAMMAANAGSLMSFGNIPLDIKVNGQRALRLESTGFPGTPNVIGGSSSNFVRAGVAGATISGGGGHVDDLNLGREMNSVHAHFGTIGGGGNNTVNGAYAAITGGHDNACAGSFSFIGGGSDNNIQSNVLGATISGGFWNFAGTGAHYSAIGGGFGNQMEIVTNPNWHGEGACATIAGGYYNAILAEAYSSSIGGGAGNFAMAEEATVAGGGGNQASGLGAAVGGGRLNTCSGPVATIGGGDHNISSNLATTVPGGRENVAGGRFAFAAGRAARALHTGAFVWSDSSDSAGGGPFFFGTPFASASTNEFAVRATGGVRFVTAVDTNGVPTAGVTLAPGSGSWAMLSDRQTKENFTTANTRRILKKVASLSLTHWNYKAQNPSIRHLGPTAQDFHAAFGLGESDRTINTVDANGVALAAIQGLHEVVQEQQAELHVKEREINALEKRLAELEKLVSSLARTETVEAK